MIQVMLGLFIGVIGIIGAVKAYSFYQKRKNTKLETSIENLSCSITEEFMDIKLLIDSIERCKNFDYHNFNKLQDELTNLWEEYKKQESNWEVYFSLLTCSNLLQNIESMQQILPSYFMSKDLLEHINNEKKFLLQDLVTNPDKYISGYYNGVEAILAILEEREPEFLMTYTPNQTSMRQNPFN